MDKPEEILMLEREMGIKISREDYSLGNNGRIYSLNLSGKKITNISALRELNKLNSLSLSNNKINDISPLSKLEKLYALYLNYNRISDISPLSNLRNLNNLYLKGNQITDISPLAKLNKLTKLHINYNEILTIPEDFVNKIKLDYTSNNTRENLINIEGNPLNAEIKQAIESGGREGLLAYYDNLKKGKKPFNEAKLIFLGEPDAGKTSLMRYLLNKPFENKNSVTRGVNLEQWKIKETWNNKEDDYRINFWDFGGQEIQQSVHQFFLTEGTLYVILLDAIKDQQPDKYLSYLNNYAPDSPFIIVINKIEAHPSAKITTNLISEDYAKRYINTFRVSIKEASQGNKPFVEQMDALEKSIRQT